MSCINSWIHSPQCIVSPFVRGPLSLYQHCHLSSKQNLDTIAVVASIVRFGPTGLESNIDTMSANNSLYASPASSSSSVAIGVPGQLRAPTTSRRNSFDMVIIIANGRAAANTQSEATAQASASAASESTSSSSTRGECTSRNRKSKPFDVESLIGTDSFEDVEFQDQFWPTPSRLAALQTPVSAMKDSNASAVALAFQTQASSGKRSIWKEWAPYFGL